MLFITYSLNVREETLKLQSQKKIFSSEKKSEVEELRFNYLSKVEYLTASVQFFHYKGRTIRFYGMNFMIN